MSLLLWNDTLLLRNSKLAVHTDCCCESVFTPESCVDCWTPPSTLYADIPAFANANCSDCANYAGTISTTFVTNKWTGLVCLSCPCSLFLGSITYLEIRCSYADGQCTIIGNLLSNQQVFCEGTYRSPFIRYSKVLTEELLYPLDVTLPLDTQFTCNECDATGTVLRIHELP